MSGEWNWAGYRCRLDGGYLSLCEDGGKPVVIPIYGDSSDLEAALNRASDAASRRLRNQRIKAANDRLQRLIDTGRPG